MNFFDDSYGIPQVGVVLVESVSTYMPASAWPCAMFVARASKI